MDEQANKNTASQGDILLGLVGSWEGTNETWFEPGKEPELSPVRGTFRRLLDGPFVIYEYQSSLGGDAFQGIALISHNAFSGEFEMAWSDTFHMSTNIMFSSGPGRPNGFSVLGSYQFDAGQPAWGWRTQLELPDPNHLIITAYNISPDGQEFDAIRTNLTRTGA